MRESVEHCYRRSALKDPVFMAGAIALYTCVLTAPAHAYLDPGTGSFLFQLLVGALVGGIFVIKSYWLRLKNWFSGSVNNVEKVDKTDAPDQKDHQ
ncbi:MAG: hypothetical protein EOM80_07365 [Erysipelotrichia bacterium]|nr:hypothetical protein [Erysipelotrichia bacterium]